jgi:hypothetical protein
MYAVSGIDTETTGGDGDVVLRMQLIPQLSDPEIDADARVVIPGHYEYVPWSGDVTASGGKLYWVEENGKLDEDDPESMVCEFHNGNPEAMWNLVSILNTGLELMRKQAVATVDEKTLYPPVPAMRLCMTCVDGVVDTVKWPNSATCNNCIKAGRNWHFRRAYQEGKERFAGITLHDLRQGHMSPEIWNVWTFSFEQRDKLLHEFQSDPIGIVQSIQDIESQE